MAKNVKPPAKKRNYEPPEVISSALAVKELKMKDLQWSMTLIVKHIMPKSYHDFLVKFVFDEKPYKDNIEMLQQKLSKKTSSLFEDMDRQEREEIRDEIESIRADMNDKKTQCVTIEFLAQVEELKYSGSDTILKVRIPDHIIEPVNKVKMSFGYYKVELQPQVEK